MPMPSFACRLVLASGVALCTLVVFLPKNTHADDTDEVHDWERAGESLVDDAGNLRGHLFGKVLVKGELKRAATGWVLVRTFENTSEEVASAVVEEKLTEQLAAHYARVSPPAVTLALRTQRVTLGPHEKRTVGIPISAAVSQRMDTNAAILAGILREEQRASEDHPPNLAIMQRTYQEYGVSYLSPLPPGKRAAREPNVGVTAPQVMAEL